MLALFQNDPNSVKYYERFIGEYAYLNMRPERSGTYCFTDASFHTITAMFGDGISYDTIDFRIKCIKYDTETTLPPKVGLTQALSLFKTYLKYGVKIVILDFSESIIAISPERLIEYEELLNLVKSTTIPVVLYDARTSAFITKVGDKLFAYTHTPVELDYALLTEMYLWQVRKLSQHEIKTMF